jgi:hypothetical protein
MNFYSESSIYDKTLSSYACRVAENAANKRLVGRLWDAFEKMDACDPDFSRKGPLAQLLIKEQIVTEQSLDHRFLIRGALVIPRFARRAYCIHCMNEDIANHSFPAWRKSWCLILRPFCDIHSELLLDAPSRYANALDMSGRVYMWHYQCSAYLRKGISLSEKIFTIKEHAWVEKSLRAQRYSRALYHKRLWLMVFVAILCCRKALLGQYCDRLDQDHFKLINSHGSITAVALETAINSSSLARARALYYCGLIFGLYKVEHPDDAIFYAFPADLKTIGQVLAREQPHLAQAIFECRSVQSVQQPTVFDEFLSGLKMYTKFISKERWRPRTPNSR